MKVLYVVGANLSKNTSANISHNAYVQGLLENRCEVDILMASSSWGEEDESLPIFKEANYFVYNSVSFIDKLKLTFKKKFAPPISIQKDLNSENLKSPKALTPNITFKNSIRNFIKKGYELIFDTSYIYNLERTWLRNALQFKEKKPYDLIISNSSPAASHKLVLDLFSKKQLTETRWVQIWEDPWYYDLYGGHSEEIRKEEHRLLQNAKEIFYVSTLTLHYQKIHFPDCADKMKHIPLPYLKLNEANYKSESDDIYLGYFGDYYSITRNLRPFYNAMLETEANALICGDSDIYLPITEKVGVNKRVNLAVLEKLQNQSDILVHLCNLRGGQIPGKIYHYSATTKPIIFILDGTAEEKRAIKEYFMQFGRYHFCENNKEDILRTINLLVKDKKNLKEQPVLEFAPKQVVAKLLQES